MIKFAAGFLAAARATPSLGAIPVDLMNEPIYKDPNSFAAESFGADSLPNTCTSSFDRINAGPYDYSKIIGTGNRFNDDYFFPATADMILWTNMPRTGSASLKTTLNNLNGFFPVTQKDA